LPFKCDLQRYTTVWGATIAGLPAMSAGAAAFVPEVPVEFWKHAVMVAGVWMTLGGALQVESS
jgi:hypothetical protein